MAFQVMGVTAGRKNSNSEILLKEALLVCQEMGAEVRMINLKDYNIIDCNGCTSCTMGMSMGKYTGCSLDDADDKKKIMDVMLNQDAVIFSAPTYDLMPSSLFLKFMHRNLAYESAFLTKIGAIEPRDRVGALIAVGGSTRSWQSMALECMQATTFTNSFKIVDMYMATQVPAPGQVLLYDEKIARAREIGKNVMEALNTDLVCDAINTAMRELFLQIVYGRSQSAFSEDGLAVGAGLEDLGKGLRSQVGTMYGTLQKGPRYLEMAEGYVTGIALDAEDQIIGYQFVSLGKMTDFIKKGDDPNTAWEKAKGQYGRVADAVKIIDPRKE